VIIDQCGKMVLGYRIPAEMAASLVTDTVRDVLQKEKVADGLVLHSDQGAQYTAQTYYDLSRAYHFMPSTSKHGYPYDNASMENFFGTLKADCLNRRKFASRKELQDVVAQYVQFYNCERIQ
jgi:putative transposase insK